MKLSKTAIKRFGITKKAWAYQRSLSQSAGRSARRIKTKVVNMAKKRRSFGGSRSSGFMNAPIKTNGMIGDALKGAGAALVVAKYGGSINIPFKYPIAGYLVGGVYGAAAAWLLMGGSMSASGTAGSSVVYG